MQQNNYPTEIVKKSTSDNERTLSLAGQCQVTETAHLLNKSLKSSAVSLSNDDLVKAEETLLSTKNRFGHESVVGMIALQLQEIDEFVNGGMAPAQMYRAAGMIYENYPHVPLLGIMLFVRKACNGDYGKVYGKLSGQDIMLWFKDFYREYMTAVEEDSYRKHEYAKGDRGERLIGGSEPGNAVTGEKLERILNRLQGKGDFTDAELEAQRTLKNKATAIRNRIMRENQQSYINDPSEENFNRIKKLADDAIIAAGLPLD